MNRMKRVALLAVMPSLLVACQTPNGVSSQGQSGGVTAGSIGTVINQPPPPANCPIYFSGVNVATAGGDGFRMPQGTNICVNGYTYNSSGPGGAAVHVLPKETPEEYIARITQNARAAQAAQQNANSPQHQPNKKCESVDSKNQSGGVTSCDVGAVKQGVPK
jgi:hypothetical protein